MTAEQISEIAWEAIRAWNSTQGNRDIPMWNKAGEIIRRENITSTQGIINRINDSPPHCYHEAFMRGCEGIGYVRKPCCEKYFTQSRSVIFQDRLYVGIIVLCNKEIITCNKNK